jgi:hypothetical protein
MSEICYPFGNKAYYRLYTSYIKGISANIELQVYSVRAVTYVLFHVNIFTINRVK